MSSSTFDVESDVCPDGVGHDRDAILNKHASELTPTQSSTEGEEADVSFADVKVSLNDQIHCFR